MKKIIYTFLAITFSLSAFSQQDPIFTHFMFNKLMFNPAFAGAKDVLDLGGVYRNQWFSNIEGAPETYNLYGHTPISKRRFGLGFSLIYDKIGIYKATELMVPFSVRIKTNKEKNHTLSFGLNLTYENFRADFSQLSLLDPVDNLVGDGVRNDNGLNFGAGVYFDAKKFYAGFSIPRILETSIYSNEANFSAKDVTYWGMAGVDLPLSKNVDFRPNLLVNLNPRAPFDFSLNANFWFYDALWVGPSYRHEDSIDFLFGYQFKTGIRVGASYDYHTSDLNNVTDGSFEIMVGYTFPCQNCTIKNLRYFN